mmetsp:Transcript_15183/g.18417  ORF Transcript_15183/g.18417 Transcript_15183/m.18417 type:complete len:565 (-) Transcript_15183:1605-3299(-)
MIKVSDLFVKILENEGVTHIFGVPGEENLDFLESLRESKIKLILTRHEQAAGFMAATIGRLTGNIGVCLSTLGPGATNFSTASAFAHLGGMPMMMITGQKPILDSKQASFQIVDIVQHFKPVTKFSTSLSDGRILASTVRKATMIATTEKPGPVLIELPEDIARGETPDRIFSAKIHRRPVPDDKSIEHAMGIIRKAERPILMIGAGGNRKRTVRALKHFVEEMGIHVVTTQMGKGVFDELHPMYLGCAALSSKSHIHAAIDLADVIINVGHDTIEKPPFFMTEENKHLRTVIHINFYPAKVDNVYFPHCEIVGDIANAVWRIHQCCIKEKIYFQEDMFAFIKNEIDESLKDGITDESFPMNIARVVHDIRKVLPQDGIASLDNGFYKIWFALLFKSHFPNTILLDNALATMGAGLPNAIAAKILYPEKKILAIAGDGGFMMNDAELATAVKYKLDIVVIILNDNCFGMIDWKQNAVGLPAFGLGLDNPDFVTFARSFGVKGYRVSKPSELTEFIHGAFEEGGVHLIEVPISYDWAKDKVAHFEEESLAIRDKALEKFGNVAIC